MQVNAIARPVGPGQFKVQVEGLPAPGDFWIIGVSRDGRTLLAGAPSRMAGWVLHRDRAMTEEERRWAARVFRQNGYDEAALQRTPQR